VRVFQTLRNVIVSLALLDSEHRPRQKMTFDASASRIKHASVAICILTKDFVAPVRSNRSPRISITLERSSGDPPFAKRDSWEPLVS
jgi:hypothetical protein